MSSDHQSQPVHGTNQQGSQIYSVYPPMQHVNPYEYTQPQARTPLHYKRHSQSSSHGLNINLLPITPTNTATAPSTAGSQPPSYLYPAHSFYSINDPLGIPQTHPDHQAMKHSSIGGFYPRPLISSHLDPNIYGHRKNESQNSNESQLSDFWTSYPSFSFPSRPLPPNALTSEFKIPESSIPETQKSAQIPDKNLNATQQEDPLLNTGTSRESHKRNISIDDIQNEYLKFYGNALHVLRGIMGFEKVIEEIDSFNKFIQHNEQLRKFIDLERQRDLSGAINKEEYAIEDFYSYLRNFPKGELISLKNSFNSMKLLLEDWLNIEEEQEKAHIPLSAWINMASSEIPGSYNVNFGDPGTDSLHSSPINEKMSTQRTAVEPFFKWNEFSLPGEQVSLQVEPIKAINFQYNSCMAPKGKLQPELSLRTKITCLQCGSDKTPEWRKGPDSIKTLCNACGLFYNKLVKKVGVSEAENELKRRKRDGQEHNRKMLIPK